MNIAQERNYARNTTREWIPMTRHRAGWNTDPNIIHIGDGYIEGSGGLPKLTVKHVNSGGTEITRRYGSYETLQAYVDNDEIHVRAASLAEISSFYVRYNQVKQLLFNLGDLVNVRVIGLRNNSISGLGWVDLSNCHDLRNLDLSGNSSVTEIDVSPLAPINFYYLGGTSINTATVDKLIQAAVDSNIYNGTMNYDPTPSPSSQGNYDTLIARGWQMGSAPSSVVAVFKTVTVINYTLNLISPSVTISQSTTTYVDADYVDADYVE